MCRLSDLTKEQVDSLVGAMPDSDFFDFYGNETHIGVTTSGSWGTWLGLLPSIKTYAGMMQLLKGKDMNKQTAQEQMAVMQIEMDKLKAIIDKPEVKTGRVMSADDLERGDLYWCVYGDTQLRTFTECPVDFRRIDAGLVFHDDTSAERHLEYLKLEQELRIAQAADGGARLTGTRFTTKLYDKDILINEVAHSQHAKISFNTQKARTDFRDSHTDEQLILLIRGV